jgi:ABC-type spermidine/putrescine transport system permease subunit I
MEVSTSRHTGGGWELLPALAFFALFFVGPLLVVVVLSTQPNELVSAGGLFTNYRYFLSHNHYVDALRRSLSLSLLTTVIGLVAGYLAALGLRERVNQLGGFAGFVLLFPVLAGPIVIVLGWMSLLTTRGPINALLAFVLPQPIRFLGTDLGIAIGLVHFVLPFMILTLLNALLRIDPALEEAAASLGADRWRTFWQVVFPLSLPGVISGSLIGFSLAISAFVTPYYLGSSFRMVVTTLISQFMLSTFNWQLASTSAVVLLAMALGIMAAYSRALRRWATW